MLLLVLLISKIKVFVLQIFKLADSTLKGTVKDTLCCYKIYSVHFSFSLPPKFYFCLNPRPSRCPLICMVRVLQQMSDIIAKISLLPPDSKYIKYIV